MNNEINLIIDNIKRSSVTSLPYNPWPLVAWNQLQSKSKMPSSIFCCLEWWIFYERHDWLYRYYCICTFRII